MRSVFQRDRLLIEEQLQEGNFSLLSLLKNPKLRIKMVKAENKFNEETTDFLFFKVNTPEDYKFLKNLRALDSVAFVVWAKAERAKLETA